MALTSIILAIVLGIAAYDGYNYSVEDAKVAASKHYAPPPMQVPYVEQETPVPEAEHVTVASETTEDGTVEQSFATPTPEPTIEPTPEVVKKRFKYSDNYGDLNTWTVVTTSETNIYIAMTDCMLKAKQLEIKLPLVCISNETPFAGVTIIDNKLKVIPIQEFRELIIWK